MPIDIPDDDVERLTQRLHFLKERAAAHDSAASEIDIEDATLDKAARDKGATLKACAATLRRDAACAHLLLGQAGEAAALFQESGREFLELGLASGSTLIALGAVGAAQDALRTHGDVFESLRSQRSRSEGRARDARRRPMSDVTQGSLRQMFSLRQTDWLIEQLDETATVDREGPLSRELARGGAYPAGETGLSIGSYSVIVEALAQQTYAGASDLAGFVREGFATLAVTRAGHIRAAMNDRYHWRLFARPAELLDLDSVVLMFVALGAGFEYERIAALLSVTPVPDDSAADDRSFVQAPLQAAEQLRAVQDLTGEAF